MAIMLGGLVFDEAHTTVEERIGEVGGRDERKIVLSGLLTGRTNPADIESALDAIVESASPDHYAAELSIRPGRCLFVRREGFSRRIDRRARVGAFTLDLTARPAFEESVSETVALWILALAGDTLTLSTEGNLSAPLHLTLAVAGEVRNPSFRDGARPMVYMGGVADGSTLVRDGPNARVWLDGLDVTPYTAGTFPLLSPGGTHLHYADDSTDNPNVTVTVAYRDRWW